MSGEWATRDDDPALWDAARLENPHLEPDKPARVRAMFDAIAPTYERVNTLASGARDAFWRREMVRLAEVRAADVMLDVACGTGDVARTFAAAATRPRRIIGLDFAGRMLRQAAARPIPGGAFVQADALRLPLPDGCVSLVTCAFGVRNFADLRAGLLEMHRVLKPGGRAVVLEFCVPRQRLFRGLYLFYVNRLMPLLATWISRDRTGAYRYLPRSVLSFPDREGVAETFRSAGFESVTIHPLTGGIVAVYLARRGR
ncbi:MAG: ubiquinone/menaquinone biosynthesis methyltransferase [Phycisphaerae bacterium]|jgi:demethylmenaquinone methyltransferase/2-methoxy-6-polyprenyl-1,4-benzoquinol methylase